MAQKATVLPTTEATDIKGMLNWIQMDDVLIALLGTTKETLKEAIAKCDGKDIQELSYIAILAAFGGTKPLKNLKLFRPIASLRETVFMKGEELNTTALSLLGHCLINQEGHEKATKTFKDHYPGFNDIWSMAADGRWNTPRDPEKPSDEELKVLIAKRFPMTSDERKEVADKLREKMNEYIRKQSGAASSASTSTQPGPPPNQPVVTAPGASSSGGPAPAAAPVTQPGPAQNQSSVTNPTPGSSGGPTPNTVAGAINASTSGSLMTSSGSSSSSSSTSSSSTTSSGPGTGGTAGTAGGTGQMPPPKNYGALTMDLSNIAKGTKVTFKDPSGTVHDWKTSWTIPKTAANYAMTEDDLGSQLEVQGVLFY
jgi:hypothetical protein